jgi:ATP-dependent RNA circularization protein (DNA/RNA ligase family)
MENSPKYNRTFHLPYSEGATNDDKISYDVSSLLNVEIVITEKLDGSNVSLESDNCYARTHSGAPTHPSFDALKSLHASVKSKIASNLQLFGEWCYALHSIKYDSLPSYLMLFNVRDLTNNMWLSWEEVVLWAEEINVSTVPVLFKGIVSSEKELKELTDKLMLEPSLYGSQREGVVVRVNKSFADDDFSKSVLKRVRKDHVQTSEHWRDQVIVKNKLKA